MAKELPAAAGTDIHNPNDHLFTAQERIGGAWLIIDHALEYADICAGNKTVFPMLNEQELRQTREWLIGHPDFPGELYETFWWLEGLGDSYNAAADYFQATARAMLSSQVQHS